MEVRTKTLCSFLLLAVAVITSGCGYTQQSRFQMSFLPPAPTSVGEQRNFPSLLPFNTMFTWAPIFPQLSSRIRKSCSAAHRATPPSRRAQRRFQQGKRSYQADDVANARREFDRAIDLMLEASDQGLIDRQQYERQLDEMVDAIHRYDLAELGAAAVVEQGEVRKGSPRRHPADDLPGGPQAEGQGPGTGGGHHFPIAAVGERRGARATSTISPTAATRPCSPDCSAPGRYRPMIQRILDEEGIPQEIDSPGAGGIRLHPARRFARRRRRHVAVPQVARQ